MNDVDDFAEAVERSSFGTPTAKALRDQTPDEIAERIVNRAEEISEEAGSMSVDRLVEQARELVDKDARIDQRHLIRFVADAPAVVAGLADAVEKQRDELATTESVAKDLIRESRSFIDQRDEARARVAALEAVVARVEKRLKYAGADRDGAYLHAQWRALNAALLDGRVPSTGQETT